MYYLAAILIIAVMAEALAIIYLKKEKDYWKQCFKIMKKEIWERYNQ